MQSESASVVICVLLLERWQRARPHVFWSLVDLDPEGELGPCDAVLLGMPGFPADRTQQNQPDNATPDRSCKDKVAALRER